MKVVLLGFTLSDEAMNRLLKSDAFMPVQTHSFAWRLVDALQDSRVSVRLLSAEPASNYPHNNRILFRGGPFSAQNIEGIRLGFVNVLVLKHLTRFAACLGSGTRALFHWRPQVLLIHGVHSPFLWYGVVVRHLSGIRTVVILTDPPGVTLASDSLIVRMLKACDVLLVRRALKAVDGVIALTAPLASDFAPGTPSLVMEGIGESNSSVSRELDRDRSRFTVLYAGRLVSSGGVERLISAVRRLEDADIEIVVLGRGPLVEWVNGQSREDGRISQVQFLSRELVLSMYANVDLLVQPRPVDQDFVRYSFPSKLLEYMASGTPVLSTRLGGIPIEYEPYVYWIENDSIEGIGESLERVRNISATERRTKGQAASEFVREKRSAAAQGARISTFLERLPTGG